MHAETPPTTPWRRPPQDLRLASGTAHVWRASLKLRPEQEAAIALFLAPEEQQRAERLRIPEKRRQFIAARAILRAILAPYAATPPANLAFCYGPQGKPALLPPHGEAAHPLQFNLSHADDLALYVVTRGAVAGIDIEHIDPQRPVHDIARRFFSPNEVHALEALPETDRVDAFYRCWTCKEAYVKARGEGLHLPLDSFDMAVNPDEAPALQTVAGEPGEAANWSIRTLAVQAGYAAACAVSPPVREWHFCEWSPE